MITYLLTRAAGTDRERGDVPGWVLITLMTAVIVAGIWGFAQGALQNILESALCTIGVNGSGANCQ
ncbi:MAG TPA: hypothetical protein VGX28_09340 [Frankiaceae bacterium]|jgi:hypothetical protein|nr:hypothetical protein [Frankiaceae bacterium]